MRNLIQRLQDNDQKAFEQIYHSYHKRVYGFAYKYTKSKAIAKEITQDFFVKLWEKKHLLSDHKSLEGQIFVILRNMVIDEMRKITQQQDLMAKLAARSNRLTENTEESILHNDLRHHLDGVLKTLPDQRKKIFQMSRDKGLSHREIAEELSISTKTVEAHIRLALKTIRTKLDAFLHLF